MYRLQLPRAGWISLCLLTSATASFSQNSLSAGPARDANSSAQVIYTGKLMGYFRVPSRQSVTEVSGCPGSRADGASPEAAGFLKLRREKYPNAILVGTGDNFAPQLEARVFHPAPSPSPGQYPKGNKELFFGDFGRWVPYEKLDGEHALRKRLAHGLGTIPNDNVGCFLTAARYEAIVPGKHDFYFGAERVRQFARYMASVKPIGHYQPVQMLGANLVLKTVPIKDPVVLPGQQEQPWFSANKWPEGYVVLNLSDQKSVYPWFSYVKIKLAEFRPDHGLAKELKDLLSRKPMSEQDLATFVREARSGPKNPGYNDRYYAEDLAVLNQGIRLASQQALYICRSSGDPNDIPHPEEKECGEPLENAGVHFVDNVLAYYYKLPPVADNATEPIKPDHKTEANKFEPEKPTVKNGHFATLEPGKNHALCGIDSSATATAPKPGRAVTPAKPYCLRFAAYTPFFYFPHQRPWKNRDRYTDPDPFVFIKDRNIAIFGVVEPNLGEQVGVLNFGWQNLDDHLNDTKLKTLVSAENPLEALRQQLDYFERWYQETVDKEKKFTGLKILLAQTSPQRARALIARFPGFQVVVSAADEEQKTTGTEFNTVWSQEKRAGSFLAVPSPAFDANIQAAMPRFGLVDVAPDGESWRLSSSANQPLAAGSGGIPVEPASSTATDKPTPVSPKDASPTKFRLLVNSALSACARTGPEPIDFAALKTPEALKWLTLCAIREKLSADVALIQKRDLFDQQSIARENEVSNIQEILDRLIWKGDLLTLMYVPGSALKAALLQSDKYVSDESAALLLVDEKGRQLETLGVFSHPVTKEKIINEAPIEDKKIYAVATTDFIAAGDTAYPTLAKEALNPRTYPAGFPEELYTISSVVCRKLFPDPSAADQYCLQPINRVKYLDESVAKQITPLPPPSRGKRFWHSSPFKWPAKSEPVSSAGDLLEQQVQRRPILTWSLRNLSWGFSSLLSSRTDAEIAEKYTGVSPASISTQETEARTFGLDTRLTRTSHRKELFLAMGIDYKRTSTGDGTAGTHPSVVQANNRITWDAAFVRGIKGGRAPLRLGMIFTFRVETPFDRPFVLFNLSTKDASGIKDQLQVDQERSWLLLPRAGLRWLNGSNSFELGVQGGWEIDALRGYRFSTIGAPVECLPNPAKTFSTCVAEMSDPAQGGLITKDSTGTAILGTRPRAGFYGKGGLSIPIFSVIKYESTYEGDLFINFSEDSPTDTKWRHILKQNLKFTVLPNLSVGPSWQVLWYRNKNAPNSYLIQHQVAVEFSFGFDLFNWREKQVQFKRKQ